MRRDTPLAYGTVSRTFHWIMAYLIVWQFVTVFGWKIFGDGKVMKTMSLLGPAHGTVGLLVFALLLPRAVWALMNRSRRLADHGASATLAHAVHGVLYLLMIVVPGLALVRTYANGKGFSLWGLQLVPQTGRKIDWLAVPADTLHAPLAWLLAALVAGHVLMALVHGVVLRDGTLRRMAGTRQR